MKTIKFRAWDKTNKTFINWNGVRFSELNSFINDLYELQQFTGLTDKNGKEIYEGDIVECGDWVPDAHCLNTWETIVKWDIDTASFVGVDGEENRVIGNIYENPNLLESTREVL